MKPTSISKAIRPTMRKGARALMYSAASRRILRASLESSTGDRVIEFAKAHGYDSALRRLSSEPLTQGKHYAKLTIFDWQMYEGRSFRLTQEGQVVYGNRIERPPAGTPLEYRNFVVTSTDLSDFNLDIPADYSLAIGEGQFTTREQTDYDVRYGVQRSGDLFYSMRGNTANPKRIIVTFPGFGPSTARVSYAVSYMKELDANDLKDALVICFQDRYLVSGTYMTVDSSGRLLFDRVEAVIDSLLKRYQIDESMMMLFGASKGASIALMYARRYPHARLLLAVPQLNLPYYFSKPFFRDNLFRVPGIKQIIQPGDLLRQYIAEHRRIDYFYTNSDELSNFSGIELLRGAPGLTKYRVAGTHSDVTRKCLPSILSVMREFLGFGHTTQVSGCERPRIYIGDNDIRLQLRLQGMDDPPAASVNWYVGGLEPGGTRFLQMVTDHQLPFVKYCAEAEGLVPAMDDLSGISQIVGLSSNGDRMVGPLNTDELARLQLAPPASANTRLILGDATVREYAVVEGDRLGCLRYACLQVGPVGGDVVLDFVDDITHPAEKLSTEATTYICQSLDGGLFADAFALRLLITTEGRRLRVNIRTTSIEAAGLLALANSEWDVTVTIDQARFQTAIALLGSEAGRTLEDARAQGRIMLMHTMAQP